MILVITYKPKEMTPIPTTSTIFLHYLRDIPLSEGKISRSLWKSIFKNSKLIYTKMVGLLIKVL